jgi:Zn-dependent peptidase ImmA (M78 family)
MPVSDYGSPQEVARELRRHWSVSRGPINNLTRLIERHGGIVVHTEFRTGEMDGVYYPFPEIPPVIFLDRNQTGDRLRFTLAHELGHIVMHQHPSDPEKVEEETDAFAGEFMMPEQDIRTQLQRLDLQKLARLKPEWGMSMAALLVRAERIGTISHRKYRSLWTKMGKAGYRKREPAELDIPKEEPKLESRLIELHLNELGYSVEELAGSVHLNLEDFRSQVYDDREDTSTRPKLHLNGH